MNISDLRIDQTGESNFKKRWQEAGQGGVTYFVLE